MRHIVRDCDVFMHRVLQRDLDGSLPDSACMALVQTCLTSPLRRCSCHELQVRRSQNSKDAPLDKHGPSVPRQPGEERRKFELAQVRRCSDRLELIVPRPQRSQSPQGVPEMAEHPPSQRVGHDVALQPGQHVDRFSSRVFDVTSAYPAILESCPFHHVHPIPPVLCNLILTHQFPPGDCHPTTNKLSPHIPTESLGKKPMTK